MLYFFTVVSQLWALDVPENSKINQPDRLWRLEPTVEIGFLAPLSHKIKFGKAGTDFDYISDGGQDNLFRYTRWEMNFRGHNKHNFRLLFQPFDVTTTWTTLEDDEKCVDVDNTGVEVVHNNECCKLFVEGDDTVKDYKNACWKTISEPVATGDAEWNEAEKIC